MCSITGLLAPRKPNGTEKTRKRNPRQSRASAGTARAGADQARLAPVNNPPVTNAHDLNGPMARTPERPDLGATWVLSVYGGRQGMRVEPSGSRTQVG